MKMQSLVQTIYGDAPNPVCMVDNKLDVAWFNDAAGELYPAISKKQFFKIALGTFDYRNAVHQLQEGKSLVLPLYRGNHKHHQLYFSPLLNMKRTFMGCLIQFFPYEGSGLEGTRDFQLACGKLDYNYRSPFAVILSGLKSLQSKTKEKEEEVRPYFQYVYRNLYLLYKYNYMLSETAKFQMDEQFLQIKQSDLYQFLLMLCENVTRLGAKERIKVTFHAEKKPVITMFDLEKITVALLNIIANAIASCKQKYPDELEKIELVLSLKEEDDHAVIEIQDNGIGIPPEKLEKITEAFYSYAAYGNGEKGLGMGLFLSKEIIKKHWGSLRIESKEGQGASVFVTLPLIRDNRPLYVSASPKEYLTNNASSFYAMLSDVLDIDY